MSSSVAEPPQSSPVSEAPPAPAVMVVVALVVQLQVGDAVKSHAAVLTLTDGGRSTSVQPASCPASVPPPAPVSGVFVIPASADTPTASPAESTAPPPPGPSSSAPPPSSVKSSSDASLEPAGASKGVVASAFPPGWPEPPPSVAPTPVKLYSLRPEI